MEVLQEMATELGFGFVVDENMGDYKEAVTLWDGNQAVGRLESRFGSHCSGEPDGYSGYIEDRNRGLWTPVLPTSNAVLALLVWIPRWEYSVNSTESAS